ncbi:stalk domain-containing protein [Paenibacillus rhizoplanae]
MKNSKWIGAALASSLLITGGAVSVLATSSHVSAAAVKTATAVEGSMTWSINGTPVALSTINSGGYKLYSLSQVAAELGAGLVHGSSGIQLNDSKGLHSVQIQAGVKSYQVDGETLEFTVAPVVRNSKTYVELTKLVTALGGELAADDHTILSFARPAGSFDTLHWSADGGLIANQSDAESTLLYKFTQTPGNYDLFSSSEGAVDFAVSADQQWGAFSDETGQLKLINLSTGLISSLGKDTSVKTDIVWSSDGKTLYFVQGDKQEKLAQISVETGEVKALLEDKVENKSELRISADGKKRSVHCQHHRYREE